MRQTITPQKSNHVDVLDGWRGISILAVLATHFLPLGPSRWNLNATAGPLGMVLFFNLSGFLITTTLIKLPDARSFFIRRAARILPLAYLYIPIALFLENQPPSVFASHFLFYANYTTSLTPLTSPLWSLCVEVQFYLFVGILVLISGRRGLYLLPLACLAITTIRIQQHVYIGINTHIRVDEILAGACVALAHASPSFPPRKWIARLPILLVLGLLLLSCHPASGPFNYFRPYMGALVIARSLWTPGIETPLLRTRCLKYLATVSYALYVIHPIMRYGWFATGDHWQRYLLKRPIGFLLVFLLAHLSTFYYEKWWIAQAKKHTDKPSPSVQRQLVAGAP